MQNIINGKFCDASNKATIKIVNPYTGRVIDTVPNSTEKDAKRAVEYALKAQKTWKNVPVHEKTKILYKFLKLVDENKDDLAKTLCKETGKPITQAYGEIANIRISFEAFCEKAKHLYGNVIPAGTEAGQEKTLQFTIREPLGVMLAIIPFNFPCDLFDQKVAPAILAGNTIIVKPPHQNPLTLIKLTKLLHDAGLPNGVVQILTGDGAIVGNALAKNENVHGITFKGSTAVGKLTYLNGAEHLAHVALELGGNDAFIVLKDADIDLAAKEVVWGRMYNTGQVCCASKRFIVEKEVLKEFEEKVVDTISKLIVGNPMDKKTDIGCLVTKGACEKAVKQIEKVVEQGGRIIYGGQSSGAVLQPTVITDIPKTADVALDEEIFAPVVSIIPCENAQEAIEIANASCYGLCGCVFTRDMKTAFEICSKLECGGTVINGASFHRSFEMPFGGYKLSGIGTEGVMSTFDQVTKTKTITLKNIF